jgi:hypothetical protein
MIYGKTRYEKQILREAGWKKRELWHPWFAWCPVPLDEPSEVSGKQVWLQWVETRKRYISGSNVWITDYRLLT